MRLIIHLLWWCSYTTLLVKVSEGVSCLKSNHSAVVPCEIDPNEGQYCYIECDINTDLIASNNYICMKGCWSDSIFPCQNVTDSYIHYKLCCTTPYCNNLTAIPIPSLCSSSSPSSDGTNKDTSDDVRYHIVIAVCVVVVVLVIAIATGCVVVIWMKLKGKHCNDLTNFRWRRF